jgi:hypothetical protein
MHYKGNACGLASLFSGGTDNYSFEQEIQEIPYCYGTLGLSPSPKHKIITLYSKEKSISQAHILI